MHYDNEVVIQAFIELTLREKCPSTEFFLVRIQENTDQKKPRISTLLTQCNLCKLYGDLFCFFSKTSQTKMERTL